MVCVGHLRGGFNRALDGSWDFGHWTQQLFGGAGRNPQVKDLHW